MSDLRIAAQQAHDNARWINDEQAIVSYEDMMRLRAALAEPGPEPWERRVALAEQEPWIRVIDEAMVSHHIGVADPADDYETAKRKLNNLLCHAQDIGAYFAKQAGPAQEPDPWGAGYEAGYAAGVAEYDPQQAQQALEEADRIMGHDDEATEWRERWGHLFGGPPPRPAASIIEPEIKDDKPFGYFRAEPFGWTDCAPTDEGAIPLYAAPPVKMTKSSPSPEAPSHSQTSGSHAPTP